jgi:hypothetical protein
VAQAKIEIKIGGLTFSGDGDAAWLEKQLDKLLQFAERANVAQDAGDTDAETPRKVTKATDRGTLSAFLKSHTATGNQVRKFLATATWLTLGGKSRLTTSQVTEVLSSNHQGKLGNPSDCLNKNVSQGYCEKDRKEFYVTAEGSAKIGVQGP